jgi:hypothetical protein
MTNNDLRVRFLSPRARRVVCACIGLGALLFLLVLLPLHVHPDGQTHPECAVCAAGAVPACGIMACVSLALPLLSRDLDLADAAVPVARRPVRRVSLRGPPRLA